MPFVVFYIIQFSFGSPCGGPPNASHQRLRQAQLAEVRLHAIVMWQAANAFKSSLAALPD